MQGGKQDAAEAGKQFLDIFLSVMGNWKAMQEFSTCQRTTNCTTAYLVCTCFWFGQGSDGIESHAMQCVLLSDVLTPPVINQ